MQERTRWLVLAGILLLAGVVAWRLTAGSYKTDIRKICDAEKASGVDGKSDVKKVEAWAKDNLETPEASAWWSELVKKGVADRAKGLRGEAKRVGWAECPLADTYDQIFADGEYRQDIAGLCIMSDLGAIEAADEGERLHKVLDYIQTKAKSTRTKALGEKLAQADPKSRPDVLREAASAVSIFQCELVNVLLKPQAKPRKEDPVIELGSPQINGDMTVDKIVATFTAKQDAMRKCYDDGLAKNPQLGGRLMLKMAIAPGGKTVKASAEKGTTLADADVVKCAVKIASELVFPPTSSPMVTLLFPLEFIPRMSLRPVPMIDPHGH